MPSSITFKPQLNIFVFVPTPYWSCHGSHRQAHHRGDPSEIRSDSYEIHGRCSGIGAKVSGGSLVFPYNTPFYHCYVSFCPHALRCSTALTRYHSNTPRDFKLCGLHVSDSCWAGHIVNIFLFPFILFQTLFTIMLIKRQNYVIFCIYILLRCVGVFH
jgi:hypothetical protein